MTTITMQVDPDLAQAYRSAPAKDQAKLQLLLNLWLRGLLVRSTPLTALMDELSDKAEARGLIAAIQEGRLNAFVDESEIAVILASANV